EFHPERPSEIWIGDSLIMVGSTTQREAMHAFLYVYVEDTDAVLSLAVARGAESLEEPRDTPYGDPRAMIRDPWGNTWQIATHGGRLRSESVSAPHTAFQPTRGKANCCCRQHSMGIEITRLCPARRRNLPKRHARRSTLE